MDIFFSRREFISIEECITNKPKPRRGFIFLPTVRNMSYYAKAVLKYTLKIRETEHGSATT
jgi:hypothetical protein